MIAGWLEQIEVEVLGQVRERGGLSARQLAARLGISESLAVSYVSLLAAKGLVSIERIALPREIQTRTWGWSPRWKWTGTVWQSRG
jgi:transcriptional regulator with XRE-family HTH domain